MERSYTQEEFRRARKKIVEKLLVPSALRPVDSPTAFLLGGQSGAGKTTLHGVLRDRLDDNAIVITGDEYRAKHPRYREFDREYGPESVNHTAEWAGRMTEELIDTLSRKGYNLIIEGTLRTAEVPTKTATLLRERGYAVSLALMAAQPEISLISCQIRYEEMRIAGTVPRATDPAHHNKIVHDIVGNLAVLERSGLFDEVFLCNRARACLFPREVERRPASEVLHEALFGGWTDEERQHKEALELRLARLRARADGGRPKRAGGSSSGSGCPRFGSKGGAEFRLLRERGRM